MRSPLLAVACLLPACAAAGPDAAAPIAAPGARAIAAAQISVAPPIHARGLSGLSSPSQEVEPPGRVPPVDAAMESAMVAKINAYRAAHGLAPLAVRPVLVDKARSWAAQMASGACGLDGAGVPKICHSELRDGITVRYALLGENVGRVSPPDTDLLEDAFERSPSHSAEMLTPSFTMVGVGVAFSGDTMFVAEELMAPPSPPAPDASYSAR